MDKSTAGRRNVKLTGFKHRVDRPTGLISFSTGHDEDITGLDEAMRSFSSKTNSIGTPPSTVTALSIPLASKSDIEPTLSTDSDREPSILSCSDADTFELAVEATTMADDSPVPVSSSSGHSLLSFESPNSDHPHPATSKLSNSHEDSETTPVSTMATVLDIDFRTAVEPVNQPPFASIGSTGECDNGDPSKPPVPPARPPPFQPRSVATPVAAADIHALLDSYPSPIRDADIPNSRLTKPSSLPVITCASPARSDDVLTSHLDIVPSQKLFTEEVGGPLLVSALSDLPISSIRAEEASSSIPLTVLREDATERDSNLSLGLPTEFDKVKTDLASGDDRKRPFSSSKRIHSRRIAQRRRSKLCNIFLLASVGLLVGCVYWFTAFFWGLSVGVLGTLLVVLIRDALWTTDNSDGARCHISGSPLGRLCCSLHCPINPTATGAGSGTWWPIFAPALPPLRNGPLQFRELPSLPVPHMNDEDLYSSAIGPLGPNLGLKLDSGDRPIYKGWMNEIMKYDAETHHVSQTHSVFITLDGMQLRLQRPRRNIARRSMWNEEIPPIGSLRFHQQRIYDLTHARVVLLPNGLVTKRLWSKKYPIAITLSPQAAKQGSAKSTSKSALSQSPSVPSLVHAPTVGVRSTPQKAPLASSIRDTVDPSRSTTTADSFDNGFVVLPQDDTSCGTLFLFGRTCREKEAWYRRFRAASLGVPLLWTPQLAVQLLLAGTTSASNASSSSKTTDNRSDEETRSDRDLPVGESNVETTRTSAPLTAPIGTFPTLGVPGSREPLYITYVRYMAKFMPANWLVRGAQALRLNVNHITCDPNLVWLNAVLARMFWDFLREAYWLERVRDKIQAKLKKIHLPPFISDLVVVGIELGSELPVIRRVGRPFLDAQGLWIEADIAYAGGFSVALETNVNLMRWNQRNRLEWEAANLADDISQLPSPSAPSTGDQPRRPSRLGAYLSDEEDSADSTTDSDPTEEPRYPAAIGVRRPSVPTRPPAAAASVGLNKSTEEERAGVTENLAFHLPPTISSRKRIIRIVDKITRSSYFQKAVDNKLVQRGMELLSNTPIVLEAEIQTLSGTLLINIPPPQSDRLWYGFRPNLQMRLKVRPRVGEKAVTMSRILEWIENRVLLEFQRLVVLPNMDDIVIPLLLSDVTAGGTK